MDKKRNIKATLLEVAKIAGVSPQTVSNVINRKKGEYSKRTEEKVFEAIKGTSFMPSEIARSLRRGKTRSIGVITPKLSSHPFYPLMIDYMEKELSKYGFNIYVAITHGDPNKEIENIDAMFRRNVDGIILFRAICEKQETVNLIKNLKIPVVACLKDIKNLNIPTVQTNNLKAGVMAAEYLVRKGHKKILHFIGPEDYPPNKDRTKGFLSFLKKNNINMNKRLFKVDYEDKDLNKILFELINNYQDVFTAIFAYNDVIAIQLMKILRRIGYKIPGSVSIIGVDNLEMGEITVPMLTTIKQPIEEICELTVKLVIDSIDNMNIYKDFSRKKILLDPTLIERESVKDIT